MNFKYISKSIISATMGILLIVLPVLMPLENAYAAGEFQGSSPGGWQNQSGAFNNGSGQFSMNMNNIMQSGVLTALIGCTGIVSKVEKSINKLFGIGKDTASTAAKTAAAKATSVPTYDIFTQMSVDTAKTNITTEQKSDAFREECLNGVAFAFAKMQLAYITQKTVNWINTGYAGDPFYVRNQVSFFEQLKKEQLGMLLGPYANYDNKLKYPFGMSFARSMIYSTRNSIDKQLQSDLLYSLKPGSTMDNYASDFSRGGWLGWLVLTQNPVNNPVGFTMAATQHVMNSVANNLTSQKNELDQNNGFLSQKKCVKWSNEADNEGMAYLSSLQDANRGTTTAVVKPTCIKTEVTTPGQVILGLTNQSTTTSARQLELAQSLNQSLYSIFSALLNKLTTEGLKSLSAFQPGPADGSTYGGNNKVYDVDGNDISSTYSGAGGILNGVGGNGWYDTKTTGFDITTDINKVISVQYSYIQAIDESRKVLPYILPAVAKLDYCIPGPNPGWYEKAQGTLGGIDNYLNTVQKRSDGTYGLGTGQLIDSFFKDIPSQPTISIKALLSKILSELGDITYSAGTKQAIINHLDFLLSATTFNISKLSFVFTDINNKLKETGLDYNQAQAWSEASRKYLRCLAEDTFWQNIDINYAVVGSSSLGMKCSGYLNSIGKDGIRNLQDYINSKGTDPYSATEYHKRALFLYISGMVENYKKAIDLNYGTESPMLDPTITSYLPMAESGLQITKNLDSYEVDIKNTMDEYAELKRESNANIYQLKALWKAVNEVLARGVPQDNGTIEKGKPEKLADFLDANGNALSAYGRKCVKNGGVWNRTGLRCEMTNLSARNRACLNETVYNFEEDKEVLDSNSWINLVVFTK